MSPPNCVLSWCKQTNWILSPLPVLPVFHLCSIFILTLQPNSFFFFWPFISLNLIDLPVATLGAGWSHIKKKLPATLDKLNSHLLQSEARLQIQIFWLDQDTRLPTTTPSLSSLPQRRDKHSPLKGLGCIYCDLSPRDWG